MITYQATYWEKPIGKYQILHILFPNKYFNSLIFLYTQFKTLKIDVLVSQIL